MGSGKSTIANYLCDTYGYSKFALGEKIHRECRIHGSETRNEMQHYGQMMRKIFGINVWCDYIYEQTIGVNKSVIEDGRQLNEYDYYVKLGYLPVGVITDKNKRIKRLKKRVDYVINPNTFNHETETQAICCVNKCKIKIYNNSDNVNDLFKEIKDKLGEYLKGEI